MPFNGAGTFQSLPPPDYPAVSDTVIRAAAFNAVINDLIAGLTNTLTKDGQTSPTSNLSMGGFKHTGVGDATAEDQYATYGQLLSAEELIEFALTPVGAVVRQLATRFEDQIFVLDYIPVNLHASIKARTCTTPLETYLAAAATAAAGKKLIFTSGNYPVRQGFGVKSRTHVFGEPGATIEALPASWTGTTGNDGTAPFIWNENRSTTTLTDTDITVEGLTFDYKTVTVVGGGAHAIRFRAVDRPRVIRCVFKGGENATAMLACRDSLVEGCVARDCINAFFDHWDGPISGTVRDCIGRNASGVSSAQGIQFTGTGSYNEDRAGTLFLSEGNRIIGVRAPGGQASALIFNSNDAGSSVAYGKSIGDYIEDCDMGVVLQGASGFHEVYDITLKNVTKLPIFFNTDGSGLPAHCTIRGVHMRDCTHTPANVALISVSGVGNHVEDVIVTNSGAAAYALLAWLTPSADGCRVSINSAPSGSGGSRIFNQSTNSRVWDEDGLRGKLATTPTVASDAIVALTEEVTFVSGALAIINITVPDRVALGGTLAVIPTGAWTTLTAGNIARAITAVVGKVVYFTYSPTTGKWYPSE